MNNESEAEFMDEHRLQEFYHNEELEFVDVFLDVFIKVKQIKINDKFNEYLFRKNNSQEIVFMIYWLVINKFVNKSNRPTI